MRLAAGSFSRSSKSCWKDSWERSAARMRRQFEHSPQASPGVPPKQLRDAATRLAKVALPTPRGPVNKRVCGKRSWANILRSALTTRELPTKLENIW